jgi:acid phosphatase type 7
MRYKKAAFVLFLSFWALLGAKEPKVIYLTWVKDPTSTMTIMWHSDEKEASSALSYHRKGDTKMAAATGKSHPIDGTHDLVHQIDIEGLNDDTDYLFKIEGSGREYHFRTMPKELKRSVRFAIGGDAYYYWGTEVFARMGRMIGHHDPDFVLVGGDLAYTTGKKRIFSGRSWELRRWQTFLRELQRTIKGSDGRLIPMMPVVGNHDVKKESEESQMFYELFTFPEAGVPYRALDFGDYLSLVLLDSGHTFPIEGPQTAWLEKTLQERKSTPYLFAAYHVSAYPSYYPFNGEAPAKLRSAWSPLFEKYRVHAAFEHHNHCYKRTHPIKAGKVDQSGVLYLGDGSWGVAPRKPREDLWYIEKTASVNACYIVTLTAEKCEIEAKDPQGELVDKTVVQPRDLLTIQ